jgi:glycosyltransferase involved in cell wall biosynthesis
MCDLTFSLVEDLYHLPKDRTVVIPHSGYVGIYPDAIDREAARKNLGLNADDIVLLALGGIRPYKGIDRLIDAFETALTREPRLRLVMAGKPGRFEGIDDLRWRADSHPNIIANFNEIAPADLQHFYKASDVAVLAHAEGLNSGALLLAYSFGRPVIAPHLGCIGELLIPEVSIGYRPSDQAGFVEALVAAPSLVSPLIRQKARHFAEVKSIRNMSSAFMAALGRHGT